MSTQRQGKSGLGLEAQDAAVAEYVKRSGGVLLRDFVEVESGKNNQRPELQAAISFANRSGAVLLVAKLDRLSRNVAFLATLLESKVNFVAVDNPNASTFTIHILAAVAQWEREAISKRTREAMHAAKARGIKFGSARPEHWKGREDRRREGARIGGERAAAIHRKKADEAYGDVATRILQERSMGASLRQIANGLNSDSCPTRRQKRWTAATVRLVLQRFRSSGPSTAMNELNGHSDTIVS